MRRHEAVERLKAANASLARFHVRSLTLFGSVARDDPEARDVDILVEFDGTPTFDQFMELKFHLEALLDCPVDLVTPKALKPRVWAQVEREGIHVA